MTIETDKDLKELRAIGSIAAFTLQEIKLY